MVINGTHKQKIRHLTICFMVLMSALVVLFGCATRKFRAAVSTPLLVMDCFPNAETIIAKGKAGLKIGSEASYFDVDVFYHSPNLVRIDTSIPLAGNVGRILTLGDQTLLYDLLQRQVYITEGVNLGPLQVVLGDEFPGEEVISAVFYRYLYLEGDDCRALNDGDTITITESSGTEVRIFRTAEHEPACLIPTDEGNLTVVYGLIDSSGCPLPKKMVLLGSNESISFEYEQLEVNKSLDPDIFKPITNVEIDTMYIGGSDG